MSDLTPTPGEKNREEAQLLGDRDRGSTPIDRSAHLEGASDSLVVADDLIAGYVPGVNILNGKVAYKQVAVDLGLPYEPVRV